MKTHSTSYTTTTTVTSTSCTTAAVNTACTPTPTEYVENGSFEDRIIDESGGIQAYPWTIYAQGAADSSAKFINDAAAAFDGSIFAYVHLASVMSRREVTDSR